MSDLLILEVCVESVEHAIAAERGGAHRVELCSNLATGGITPSAGLMKVARKAVRIPIFVLIRPRPGDFVYSKREFETMAEDIQSAKRLGMDGIVLGPLTARGEVDVAHTKELVRLAHPLPVTFHHAFDETLDLQRSLRAVIKTGAKRVLTSGGTPRVVDNLSGLAELVVEAGESIVIMPGGGITAGNIDRIFRRTSAREFHSSVGTSLELLKNRNSNADGGGLKSFRTKVKELAKILANDAR